MTAPLFIGCAAALITPFHRDSSVDTEALVRLIDMQLLAGMDAIVLLGTTGEASTLSMQEREQIITLGVQTVNKAMPVIVGTGSNDTRRAIEYARQAKALGADGQLSVTPYYNKATQRGLIRHFSAIAESCDLPMLLYNVPSRTGVGISAETVRTLCAHPGIVGIKEASGDLSLTADILKKTEGALPVYAGNDDIILPMMAQGAMGAISVVANMLPAQTRAITNACLSGCYDQAQSAQRALLPLIRLLFSQVNPIPVKAALSAMGLIEEELRLPLTPMEEPHRSRLISLLWEMRLIPGA